MNVNNLMADLERKHPGESEYLQAVREVLESIEEVYNDHPEFERAKIVERMVEPDRIITFRVTWVDDKGEIQTNLGYRVQFNSAIGPYKGGIRFHAVSSISGIKLLKLCSDASFNIFCHLIFFLSSFLLSTLIIERLVIKGINL